MTEKVLLNGVAWDHPRCTAPLEASLAAYRRLRPEVEITWDRRSLFSFGEGDLGSLAAAYDLVIYDHPFIGEIAQSGAMLDLGRHRGDEEQAVFAADSLGPSLDSYRYGDGLFALPIDAAAQTAAFRPDLMSRSGSDVPKTLDEVFELADRLRTRDMHIVTPLKQIDALCLLFTLSANLGSPVDGDDCQVMPDDVFATCLDILKRLAGVSHPASKQLNPIQAYDMMSSVDDIAYAPYLFCYSNYARPDRQKVVRSANMPGVDLPEPSGSCIGGAGLGISSGCKNIDAAVDYARFLCAPAYQSGDYVRSGGQPASRSAWRSEAANEISNDFFCDCFETLHRSYLRPRYPGFMDFARSSGPILVAYLNGDNSTKATTDSIRAAYRETKRANHLLPSGRVHKKDELAHE